MKHVLPVLAVLVVSACMNERVLYTDPSQNASLGGGGKASNINLQSGTLRGDFGPRTGFDGAATDMQGTSDSQWKTSTITVARSEDLRGTGMVIIWTNGITLQDLTPGAYTYDYNPDSLDTVPVSMNVCSGDTTATIDYDRPVDHVTATVRDTTDGRAYDLHTETAIIDINGNVTGDTETSDTSFVLGTATQG